MGVSIILIEIREYIEEIRVRHWINALDFQVRPDWITNSTIEMDQLIYIYDYIYKYILFINLLNIYDIITTKYL